MRVQLIEVTRAAFGLALLSAPRRVLGGVHGLEVDSRSVAIARILGARQLAQAGLSSLDPSPDVLAMGTWVDLAHGATAVGLAAADRERRVAGVANAAAAVLWAGWGYADLRRDRPVPAHHQPRRSALARWLLDRLPGGGPLLRAATRRQVSQRRR